MRVKGGNKNQISDTNGRTPRGDLARHLILACDHISGIKHNSAEARSSFGKPLNTLGIRPFLGVTKMAGSVVHQKYSVGVYRFIYK